MLKVKKQLATAQQEELDRLWQETDKQLERERIPRQEDWKNRERQRGTAMHSNELIRRVIKLNPAIWAEDSIRCKGNAGFYYPSPVFGSKTFTGAHFKKGMVREFSVVFVDAADRPVAVEYGWREVLCRLLKLKLISWDQIKANFPLYESIRSEAFDQKTQELKNRGH
jgi:hypothetical protein